MAAKLLIEGKNDDCGGQMTDNPPRDPNRHAAVDPEAQADAANTTRRRIAKVL
jgi:hypothetical protein